MAWIGWQGGMTGPTVQAAKRKLRAKFGYAKDLDDTEYFDEILKAVLITYQTRKNVDGYQPPLRTDGVVGSQSVAPEHLVKRPERNDVAELPSKAARQRCRGLRSSEHF